MFGALILAGGHSGRMKRNKALIKLGDKPLLLLVVESVYDIVNEVVVVVGKNDDLNDYANIFPDNTKFLKDKVNRKGPLAGMLVGMRSMHSDYAVVLPCDSPFVESNVVRYLFDRAKGADAAIPRWPNQYIEPLHSVYRVSSCVPIVENAIRNEDLFIRDMINQLNRVVYVETDDLRRFDSELLTFFNLNSPEDLKIAESLQSRI